MLDKHVSNRHVDKLRGLVKRTAFVLGASLAGAIMLGWSALLLWITVKIVAFAFSMI